MMKERLHLYSFLSVCMVVKNETVEVTVEEILKDKHTFNSEV